jgi:hypothetical protein
VTVISNSVEIRCTPEEAFDYLSDHRNELEWNTGIESIDKLTDGPVGLGTRYLAKWKSAPKAVEVETTAYEGYSQDKPETRSWRWSPWSAGVPVNRAGGLPRGWSRASENPKLSAERPGERLQRTGSPSGGQTRRRGRARASTHGEAGPLWVSCLSWPYP